MRSLHIIEPHAQGHRMQFVRRLIDAALPSTDVIHLSTMKESLGHSSVQSFLPQLGDKVQVHVMPPPSGSWLDGWCGPLKLQMSYWRQFHRHWANLPDPAKDSIAFLPYADYCLHMIGVLGSPFGASRWSGITMRQDFHFKNCGVIAAHTSAPLIKRGLFLRALQSNGCPILFTVDPTLPAWLAKRSPCLTSKLRAFDDPSDISGSASWQQARSHFSIATDAIVILVFGSIDMRKGIDELLELMNESHALPATCVVLSVGRHSPEVLSRIGNFNKCSIHPRWIIADRYVDAKEEYLAMRASDWMWIGYKDFLFSSGCLAQANQAQLPILASRQGLIGWHLACGHVPGLFCDAITPQSIVTMRKGDKAVLPAQAHFAKDIIDPLFDAII